MRAALVLLGALLFVCASAKIESLDLDSVKLADPLLIDLFKATEAKLHNLDMETELHLVSA